MPDLLGDQMSRGLRFTLSLGVLMAVVGVGLLALRSEAREVTVYSSLPLHGAGHRESQDMIKAIRLALEDEDHKAGKFKVRYVSLDDSTQDANGWAQRAVVENAFTAAEDASTAVYIGEYDSGASAVSIPILSRAKVPQISPSNTAVGLTTSEPGANAGEPDKYYVGSVRNYVRLVPKDSRQGAALTSIMRQDGCKRTAIIYDSGLYGSNLALIIRKAMIRENLRRVLDEPYDSQLGDYDRVLARRAANQKADCVVFVGTTSTTVGLFKQLAQKLPYARLYGSDGVAHRDSTRALKTLRARVKLTFPMLGSEGVGVAGTRFFNHFRQVYSTDPDPYAIYGYEAMRLAIDAIRRAGSSDREDIIKALHETRDRRSAIGTYSIDPNGDTTLTDYGLFMIGREGLPIFKRRIPTD